MLCITVYFRLEQFKTRKILMISINAKEGGGGKQTGTMTMKLFNKKNVIIISPKLHLFTIKFQNMWSKT